MTTAGYDPDRFIGLTNDAFECIICSQVVMDPFECHGCGKLFCKLCIADWINKNPASKCPNRCSSQITAIFSKALIRMYSNLDILCSNKQCKKKIKLSDIKKHEEFCFKVKCWNVVNCEQVQNDQLMTEYPCCS